MSERYGEGLPPAGGWKRDMPEPKPEHTHGPFAGPYSSCPACSAARGYEGIASIIALCFLGAIAGGIGIGLGVLVKWLT